MLWVITFIIGLLGGAAIAVGVVFDRLAKARRYREEGQAERAAASQRLDEAKAQAADLAERRRRLDTDLEEFGRRVVTYDELANENTLLKRDLQNIDVNLNKRLMDNELLHQQQVVHDQRATQLAKRYLTDVTKWISASLTPNNFSASKDRLVDIIKKCREIGFNITAQEEDQRLNDLKIEYEHVVRIAVQREEQAKIKAQIREEERLQREAQRVMDQARRESDIVQAALDRALAQAQGQHSEEIERLKAQLAEAEAKSARALSMAQQTKAGNIYVISNRGSFGDGVFKIGMTRRLEPLDRVKELGDASVPFPFDVHMMVSCTDAPALEYALHKALHGSRFNKVNPRKEFFRSDIDFIAKVVEENHGRVEYVAEPEALEYNESLTLSDEDAEFIERTFEAAEGEKAEVVED